MPITALPTPPTRDDAANFSARADAFLSALPTFAVQANALAEDVNDDAAAAAADAAAAEAAKTLAQDWATKTGSAVAGGEYSAKYHALAAAASAAAAATFNPALYAALAGATFTGNVAINGNTTLGDASGDSVTINASTILNPNTLNFSSAIGIGTSPATTLHVAGTDPIVRIQATNGGSGNGTPQLALWRDGGVAGSLTFIPNVELRLRAHSDSGLVTTMIGSTTVMTVARATGIVGTNNLLTVYGSENVLAIKDGAYLWASNSAGCVLQVGRAEGTSRSINAAGSINASGSDYAEYRYKHAGCGAVPKGGICGLTARNEVTTDFALMVLPAIKSVDPAYVGGDTWGNRASVGDAPRRPVLDLPEYDGPEHPGDGPAPLQIAPFLLGEAPVAPGEFDLGEPVLAPRGEDEDDHAFLRRMVRHELAHDAWTSARSAHEARVQDHPAKLDLWTKARAQYDALVAQAQEQHAAAVAAYQDLLDAWEAARADHNAAVEEAEAAHAAALIEYEVAVPIFTARLEAERQKVDRISYVGVVPGIVELAPDAAPGDYVVAVSDGAGGIKGITVYDPTPAQRRMVVGRAIVLNPSEDDWSRLLREDVVRDPAWTCIVDVVRG
ncbi:MAG: hypothetical protein INF91_04820 [Alphaproteobacteria bacterium]|nr:hypothetical protein [Alphaproteobacteria bacterium]